MAGVYVPRHAVILLEIRSPTFRDRAPQVTQNRSIYVPTPKNRVQQTMLPSLPRPDLEQVLNLAGPDLSTFRGGRIFLTGSTGFFGRWLAETWAFAQAHLQLQGELHILSRDPEMRIRECPHLNRHAGIHFHRGDQSSFDFPEGTFDAVIHGAVEHGSPAQTFLKNLEGMHRTLEFAKAAKASRFLLISSGAVYGIQPPALNRIPESYPGTRDALEASSAYSLAKSASEFLACEATRAGGPDCVIARAFAFLGPGLPLDRNYAIGNFIRDAMGSGPIRIEGDGTPFRSYLYAGDLAVWLWALLARGCGGMAYNVGSPDAISILNLAERVRNTLCPGRAIIVAEQPDPTRSPARYVPDTSHAEQELGLKVTVPLETGLQRTAAWMRTGVGAWA